jgi:hypothetical protein
MIDSQIAGTMNSLTGYAQQLTERGAELPAPIVAATARLHALQTATHDVPNLLKVRETYARRLVDGDSPRPGEWVELVTLDERHRVHVAAENVAARELVATWRHHAADVVRLARTTWHEPAVTALASLAERVPAGATVATLQRAGRADDARDLATADVYLADIRVACDLRGRVSKVSVTADWLWKNQHEIHDVNLPHAGIDVDAWLTAFRAGGVAWFPTTAELTKHRAAIRREHGAAQEAKRDKRGARAIMTL